MVEMGMNIANLSLDSVGKKAQGINRALISVVNQQEEGERGRMCERLCMSKTEQEGEKKPHLISSEASSVPFSTGRVICLILLAKLSEGDKHKHLAPPSKPSPQAALHAFVFFSLNISSII